MCTLVHERSCIFRSFMSVGGRLKIYEKEIDYREVSAIEGQMRQTGEPYVQHPLAVAGILTFLKLDVPAIAAGLLHDTLEDTVATQEELEKEFGADVARLVEGVTKIGQIPFKSYEEKQA